MYRYWFGRQFTFFKKYFKNLCYYANVLVCDIMTVVFLNVLVWNKGGCRVGEFNFFALRLYVPIGMIFKFFFFKFKKFVAWSYYVYYLYFKLELEGQSIRKYQILIRFRSVNICIINWPGFARKSLRFSDILYCIRYSCITDITLPLE